MYAFHRFALAVSPLSHHPETGIQFFRNPVKFVRTLFLLMAAGALLVLPFIVFNIASFSTFRLERFREPTLILYGCLVALVLLRRDPAAFIHSSIGQIRVVLEQKRFFPMMAGIMLILFVCSSLTRHLAFQTFSHDFSMIDEALYNSYHGKFLFSPILGMSFLGEHFSAILIALIPLHFIFRSPYLLVVLQPIVLWSSVLVLRKLLSKNGASAAVQNFACLLYLNNPILIRTLNYLFHMECFLPLALLGLFWYYQTGPKWKYWLTFFLALTIKEDVGIYVIGFAVYVAIFGRKFLLGLVTGLVSCLWVILALNVGIPYFLGSSEPYKFLYRWNQWGNTPWEILLGYLLHPIRFGKALFGKPYLHLFASILFLPFFRRGAFLLLVIAWIVNSTSSERVQAGLAIYYGLPVFVFSVMASVLAFQTTLFRRITESVMAPYIAFTLLALNVAHISFPEIPRERSAFLYEVSQIPPHASLQTMSCLYPALGYTRNKALIDPQNLPTAKFVFLRVASATWPFTQKEASAFLQQAVQSRKYKTYWNTRDFYILRRVKSERTK